MATPEQRQKRTVLESSSAVCRAGLSMDIAKWLVLIFVILTIVSFVL